MSTTGMLPDFNHPAVTAKAKEITEGKINRLEKIEAIFHFMRDGIKFRFPSTWHEMKDSETLNVDTVTATPKQVSF